MIDFEVEYHDVIGDKFIISKVYDTWHGNFLIVDENKHFIWVPASDCKLAVDYAKPTTPAWDSYERWVEESQKDY